MATEKDNNSRLVYSTGNGRICPGCGMPVAGCVCRRKNKAPGPKGDGIVRIGRETKGRKGKGVTTITGIPLPHDGLLKLAKQLKQKCGTGGTVKDGVIEIQGDHRSMLIEELTRQGYTVKQSGG
ncbi:MAG: translation initiation factor Sui1 [Desulfobacterales bacterium]|nr:translation initiation factor Sui1 [Desulfobacterales bacterium]MDD4392958.1 translation initiation factor Sui1 [Desulfobacterales bacterium]